MSDTVGHQSQQTAVLNASLPVPERSVDAAWTEGVAMTRGQHSLVSSSSMPSDTIVFSSDVWPRLSDLVMNFSQSHDVQVKRTICKKIMNFNLNTPRLVSVPGITDLFFEVDNAFSKLTQVGVSKGGQSCQ